MTTHDQPINRGGGLDSIIEKQTPVQQIRQEKQQEQERARIRGTSPTAPPGNQSLGAVVSFEKTDLWFVFSFLQLVLLVGIFMEVRGR